MVEEMKIAEGFQQTEAGVIPVDWNVEKFENITNVITCGVAATPKYVNESIGKPFLSAQNVQNGKVLFSNYKFIGLDLYKQITKHNKPALGDILYTRVGAGIGEAGVIEKELDFAIYVSLTLIKVKSVKIYNYYLLQVLNNPKFKVFAISNQYFGAGVQNLNVAVVRNFQIPLPPTRTEQTAIATALSDMDTLIEGLEKLLIKKRNIKQGAMQELLRPKEGWKEKKLGEVLKVKHGKSQKEVSDSNGAYPILASGGVIGRAYKYLYNKPSVLIGRKGTIDVPQFMDTPFWTVDTLFFTEIFKGNDAKFIFYMFNQIDWYSYNEASGVPSLNAKTIEKIKRYFPRTKSEQEKISSTITDMDTEIVQLETQLSKYKMLKTGMMQDLLTGKKRLI